MSNQGWKQAERRYAGDVGETRIPVTGERAGRDFGTRGPFAYQLKTRKTIPTRLFTWVSGIVGTARETDQVGVLVLNRRRARRGDALVVLRWADWVDLHGVPAGREMSAPEGGSV